MNAGALPVVARAKSSAWRSIHREKPLPSGSWTSPSASATSASHGSPAGSAGPGRPRGGLGAGGGRRAKEEGNDQAGQRARQRRGGAEEDRRRHEPPERRHREESVDELEGREAEHPADYHRLHAIREPSAERLVEKPEASRQPVAPDQRHGKAERAVPGAEHERDQRDLAPAPGREACRPVSHHEARARQKHGGEARRREAEAQARPTELEAMVARGVGHVALYTSVGGPKSPNCLLQ